MKHLTFYASMLLVAAAVPAMGRTTLTVSAPGAETATFDITGSTVIDFAAKAGSLVVKGSSEQEATFSITNETVLTFKDVSGVKDIVSSEAAVALRQNPVETCLEFTAAPASPCNLRVYSLMGTTLLSVAGWQGETVDVSTLSTGLYIVNFNNQSIKFYKK